MKSPDALNYAIKEAFEDEEDTDFNDVNEVKQLCERWFQYGEYLTVEIDTEKKTCTVVGNDK